MFACGFTRYGLSHARRENKRANFFLQGTDSEPLVYQASCSLYNSWHTLKQRGGLFYKVGNTTNKEFIRPGHYNEDGIVKSLEKAFSENPLLISTHTPTHTLTIGKNKNTAGFWVDEDLSKVLNISPKVMANEHFFFKARLTKQLLHPL